MTPKILSPIVGIRFINVFPPPKGGPIDTQKLDQKTFAALCKALGHPARLQIVEHLRLEEQCVCGRIVDILPLAQSTVSQHLKLLKNAGLIRGTVEGPRTCYCLNDDLLTAFKKAAAAL